MAEGDGTAQLTSASLATVVPALVVWRQCGWGAQVSRQHLLIGITPAGGRCS